MTDRAIDRDLQYQSVGDTVVLKLKRNIRYSTSSINRCIETNRRTNLRLILGSNINIKIIIVPIFVPVLEAIAVGVDSK